MHRRTYAAIALLATTALGTACAMTGDEEVGSTGQSVKTRPTATSTGTTSPSGTTTAAVDAGPTGRCCCSEDNSDYICGDRDAGKKYSSISCLWTLGGPGCAEGSPESTIYTDKKKCENATSLRCQATCDAGDAQHCKDKWGDHQD